MSYECTSVLSGKGLHNKLLNKYSKNGQVRVWHYTKGNKAYIVSNTDDVQDIRKEMGSGLRYFADGSVLKIIEQKIQITNDVSYTLTGSVVLPGSEYRVGDNSYTLITLK